MCRFYSSLNSGNLTLLILLFGGLQGNNKFFDNIFLLIYYFVLLWSCDLEI